MSNFVRSYLGFAGPKRIASGDLRNVAFAMKTIFDTDRWTPVVIFDAETSAVIDLDFSGTAKEVLRRLPAPDTTGDETPPRVVDSETKRPGRPKLGVVAREVTLLPRHWEWLSKQSGGASVALRKLVEHARRDGQGRDHLRSRQEAAYRFLSAMGGNLPGFEEAARALFAGDQVAFEKRVESWPADIHEHASRLAGLAFEAARLASPTPGEKE